jgi:O-acetyl-ADP-ribose deacetylase (regulator of RNase III)
MQIEVIKGSILEVDADVIVNPANSLGFMGGGVAGVIKRFGGEEIEKEAVQRAPIPVGSAVLTSAGKLKFKGVIHAPTMEEPAMDSSEEKVRESGEGKLGAGGPLGL